MQLINSTVIRELSAIFFPAAYIRGPISGGKGYIRMLISGDLYPEGLYPRGLYTRGLISGDIYPTIAFIKYASYYSLILLERWYFLYKYGCY